MNQMRNDANLSSQFCKSQDNSTFDRLLQDQTFQNLFNWTNQAARQAKELRGKPLEVTAKTDRDWVTDADIAVDTFLRDTILKEYPEHQILSEELSPEQLPSFMNGPLWIVDPIDGTHNFARGHHQTAVSVAYAEDGVVLHACVYNPFTEECFAASKGKGAFLNNNLIEGSNTAELSKALIGIGRPFTINDNQQFLQDLGKILDSCFGFRRLGSGALDICWVACGRIDAFFETLHPWDIAAAGLIAREAGCITGALRERSQTLPEDLNPENFLVANQFIFEKVKNLLNK